MNTKVVYIVSNVDKALGFEWTAKHLHKSRVELVYVLLNPGDSALERYLVQEGIVVYRIPYTGKKDLLKAVTRLYRILKKEKAEAVHTHLFDATLTGLLAARLAGVPKRIHTRHHGTLHHVYFPRAVYYDKLNNFLSTRIIAISNSVKQILVQKEGVPTEKVTIVHHGFELDLFSQVGKERAERIKSKYRIPQNKAPTIGVISRYTHWKGIQYIIPAFRQVLSRYPKAHLILANAKGDYEKEIKSLLRELPEGAYTEIVFEEDLPALYQLFDVYVHVPIDNNCEAFGQTYVEALAAGVPGVFTHSGVACEFIINKENGWVVPYEDSLEIYKAIEDILKTEEDRKNEIIGNGRKQVEDLFPLQKMIDSLVNLYEA